MSVYEIIYSGQMNEKNSLKRYMLLTWASSDRNVSSGKLYKIVRLAAELCEGQRSKKKNVPIDK